MQVNHERLQGTNEKYFNIGGFNMARFTLPRDIYFGENALDELKVLKGKKKAFIVTLAAPPCSEPASWRSWKRCCRDAGPGGKNL